MSNTLSTSVEGLNPYAQRVLESSIYLFDLLLLIRNMNLLKEIYLYSVLLRLWLITILLLFVVLDCSFGSMVITMFSSNQPTAQDCSLGDHTMVLRD